MAATPPCSNSISRLRARFGGSLRKHSRDSGTWWDSLSVVLFAVLGGLVALTFRDYGITTDEHVQQIYGEKLWAFYLSGFTDRSAFHFENLYLYGGLFDMVAVALQQILPLDIYDTRHLLCGLVGVLGVIGTWRLARDIGDPRVGFIAATMLALSASWYGATFNNTKDIPFAVGMIWLLYMTCLVVADLPRPRLRHVVALGIIAGLTLGQRFGGVLALVYLAAGVFGHLTLTTLREGWRKAGADGLAAVISMLPALPIAYVVMGVFWPWAVLSPLNPLQAVSQLTDWPTFATKFDGTNYPADALPWSYLPSYIAIKVPEVVLLGLLLAVFHAVLTLWRCRGVPRRNHLDQSRFLSVLTITLALLVPFAYVLATRPAMYNGMRHFFFLMPPLYVLAALGLNQLCRSIEQRPQWIGVAFAGIMFAAVVRESATMIELHPHQYVYFNTLVGGPAGAYRNYEMDYWSNFVPEAIQQLDAKIRAEYKGKQPPRTYTVGVCTTPHALEKVDIRYLKSTRDWRSADFIVPTTNGDCDQAADGRTIISIERDGAVLGVVKDRRARMRAAGDRGEPNIR